MSSFREDVQTMLEQYLAHLMTNKGLKHFMMEELEVRFNPYNKKFFSKTDYDNVIAHLMACNYRCNNTNGINMMRIQTESHRKGPGVFEMSNIRAELNGTGLIHEYCKQDENLPKIVDQQGYGNMVKFTLKSPAKNGDEPIKKINNDDFNFNVSFNLETDYSVKSPKAVDILQHWNESKKTYRLINRIRFENQYSPVVVDLSIIRSSKTSGKTMIPENNMHDAGVFTNQEVYEIELEIDNKRVGYGTPYTTSAHLLRELQVAIRLVLSGLQDAKFPIPYSEYESVLSSYMYLLHGKSETGPREIRTRDFIGPNSCTLQLKNIIDNSQSADPNIKDNYCVTDKADGDRKLMYIDQYGKIYLIDTNMRVQFTGTVVDRNAYGDTLLDGEHIKYDKSGKYKNTYAAFDIYYLKGESKRELNFMSDLNSTKDEKFILKNRYPLLKLTVEGINKISRSFVQNMNLDIDIHVKTFDFPTENSNIFDKCSAVLSRINDNTYPYNTDGIIFTPTNTGVGGSRPGQASKLEKITWPLSFKWKPPAFNTIDFLVTYKKDKNGKEVIHNEFESGVNMGLNSVRQYRTLVLMCGFNKGSDMILNPYQNMLDDVIPEFVKPANKDNYIPVPFQPSMPYDPDACFCNVNLEHYEGKPVMKTVEDETFEDNMIVEFSYDPNAAPGWRWKPLRVRHDKTYEFRNGNKNFGNSYLVANDNWKSIHFPITEEMLRGDSIPDKDYSDETYYNKSMLDNKYTLGMRNFHNLYVKKKLITSVSQKDDTLIDFAVGKGGDIPKWKSAQLKFVLGIDINKDNIINQSDGACTRYLNERKHTRNMFKGLFIPGNSALNIRDGTAFYNEKDKSIAAAVFGSEKLNSSLGKAVSMAYDVARNGFNISSCQFAIHYMFENNTTLHNFLRNVAECTAVNGYFVGTCYDGQTVFNKLKNKNNYSIYVDGTKIFDIVKAYKQTGFADDETSVGYPISVFQDSINKYATEYLVNFEYLERLMSDYGFALIGPEEAKQMGFNKGSALFEELYQAMKKEPNTKLYGEATNMNRDEKEISFMNRYFIFKKIHHVNAAKITKVIRSEHVVDDIVPADKPVEIVLKVRKTDHMVTLDSYMPPEPEGPPPGYEEQRELEPPEPEVPPPDNEEPNKEHKERCKKGTRRVGNECLTPEQIEALKRNKTRKNV